MPAFREDQRRYKQKADLNGFFDSYINMNEVSNIFFAVDIFFNDNYDIVKYNYKVPESWNRTKRIYEGSFKYKFETFVDCTKTEIKALAIINQLKYKSSKSVHHNLNKNDLKYFKEMVMNHVMFFRNDIKKITESCSTYYEVFAKYKRNEIYFYTFLLIPFFLQQKISSEMKLIMKDDLKRCSKAMKLLNLDIEKMRKEIYPLKQKFILKQFTF